MILTNESHAVSKIKAPYGLGESVFKAHKAINIKQKSGEAGFQSLLLGIYITFFHLFIFVQH